MQANCLVFVGNRLLLSFPYQWEPPPIERQIPGILQHSKAFFCRECGDIWARILIEGFAFSQPLYRPCFKHIEDFRLWSGSLWDVETQLYLRQAPASYWDWEIERLVAAGLWAAD